ncbi:MAG: response regulator transcription factor [Pseudotabrizicola sp.]|uniref:response regulator transcription factor n=1 Tax=Pseudotabrizicola sp. TaxID=2939647 RepID=UPI0027259894|nr:response regulator transcription factor [Pseudotabrizicola sp.]MDO8881958.1 response regulator transcription factor [Pseudotabrizicola sp.]MDP2079672.1 response regulator transcription factor [Pseudotabrizicola sp.]MDZ7574565.1 response regulator transcription factor [Pseudotabrizicola sp.]
MRVLIADDHDLLRDTLALWFRQENIDVTLARDLPSALDAVAKADAPFDLILLDYGMSGMNGLDGLELALREVTGARIALMSGTAPREIAEKALEMGAAGFLPKTLSAKSLVNAVRFMAMGEQFAPIDFMTAPAEVAPLNALAEKLSPRETQVLKGLCEGKANKEIARDLGIQEPTVKLHMKTLYRKIGAHNRTQAAMIAKEAGLF